MDTSQILIALMAVLVASAPGVVALIAQRKKVDADTETVEMQADKLRVETSDIIRKATAELSNQYRDKVFALEAIVTKLSTRIDDLQGELRDAYVEIRRLNEALKQANKNTIN